MGVIKQVKKMTMEQFQGMSLVREIEKMMKELEAFYRKNIFLDKTTRDVVFKIHQDMDGDMEVMEQGVEEALKKTDERFEKLREEAKAKILSTYERRSLQRKLRGIREEYGILQKHELWGK